MNSDQLSQITALLGLDPDNKVSPRPALATIAKTVSAFAGPVGAEITNSRQALQSIAGSLDRLVKLNENPVREGFTIEGELSPEALDTLKGVGCYTRGRGGPIKTGPTPAPGLCSLNPEKAFEEAQSVRDATRSEIRLASERRTEEHKAVLAVLQEILVVLAAMRGERGGTEERIELSRKATISTLRSLGVEIPDGFE